MCENDFEIYTLCTVNYSIIVCQSESLDSLIEYGYAENNFRSQFRDASMTFFQFLEISNWLKIILFICKTSKIFKAWLVINIVSYVSLTCLLQKTLKKYLIRFYEQVSGHQVKNRNPPKRKKATENKTIISLPKMNQFLLSGHRRVHHRVQPSIEKNSSLLTSSLQF